MVVSRSQSPPCAGLLAFTRGAVVVVALGWMMYAAQWQMTRDMHITEKVVVSSEAKDVIFNVDSTGSISEPEIPPSQSWDGILDTEATVKSTADTSQSGSIYDDAEDMLTTSCLDKHKNNVVDADSAMQLTHLINPFDTSDVHFNFTLRSIAAAKRYADSKGIRVEILGVSFQSDENLKLPPEVTHLPILDNARSAGAELVRIGVTLGEGEKPLVTPMVADVFREGFRRAKGPIMVWTNFDLVVREDFYEVIYEQTKTKVGFSVLRKDLMIEKSKNPSLSDWTVDDLFKHDDVRNQAGHDCMVFPTRWIPCLQLDRFVFGVGGWGYAVFGELNYLSKLEKNDKKSGFSILKPGQHIPASAITRHIGSQDANPQRWYSNPQRWLGPLRRNQLAYNMRLKLEVEMKLAIERDQDKICLRVPEAECPDLFKQGKLCPLKPSGSQQPLGLAFMPPTRYDEMTTIIRAFCGMEIGSMHDSNLTSDAERGQRVLLATHTHDLIANQHLEDMFETTTIVTSTTKAPRWPTPPWNAILLIVDNDPAASIVDWFVSSNGNAIPETVEDASRLLEPWISKYVEFYKFWTEQALHGAILTSIIDPIGGGDPQVAAQEMVRLREAIMQIKLGYAGRWCRVATTFSPCCGVRAAFDAIESKNLVPEGPVMSESVKAWLRSRVNGVSKLVKDAWLETRSRINIPNASSCCSKLPDPKQLKDNAWVSTGSKKPSDSGRGMTTAAANVDPPPFLESQSNGNSDDSEQKGISSMFLRNTRHMRVRQALPKLFDLKPADMLPKHRSPCWKFRNSTRCVPSFFVMGPKECGSAELFVQMSRHSDVMKSVPQKTWLSSNQYPAEHYVSTNMYDNIDLKDVYVGDGTPDYLWGKLRGFESNTTIAEAIAEMNPEAKIIITLCNATTMFPKDYQQNSHRRERDVQILASEQFSSTAFTNYTLSGIQYFESCTTSSSLKGCLRDLKTQKYSAPSRLAVGCYAPFVEEYLAQFGENRVLVLTLDELSINRRASVSKAFSHVGLSEALNWEEILDAENRSLEMNGENFVSTSIIQKIQEFYGACDDQLSGILGRKVTLDL